ncbi:TonB-dependent receptor [Alteromonas sp. M12]|uniref:TonB-dependent receptor n=1 Tax=Alteromonas sp. M12 TaxID=3135644 RepID=UPI00319E2800
MMKKILFNQVSCKRSILATSFTGALLSVSSPSIIAQEVNAALQADLKDDTEIIEVTGVRSSLENALNVKRNASSIVDAISATDIDSLPALDLGEALQLLPGVQLNTEDAQRNSEISLRGLGSGFVLTTAEGQSFATPSRSSDLVGSTNPFGSFEASVFDGITVIKSPTADIQEGGIAGVVDKTLQRALGKPDGRYTLSLGSRYEELAQSWDNEFRFSGSKHLIKDKLAVAVKVAGSEQNFRRDTANWDDRAFVNEDVANVAEFIERHGLEENASIYAPVRARQITENARGDRISATGNIEWQASESIKLGANILYTKRVLDESNMEDVNFSIRSQLDSRYTRGPNAGEVMQSVELLGNPVRLNDAEDGSPIYTVDQVELTNVTWAPANRLFSYTEEAKGIFLYGDYVSDDWLIDSTISASSSSNQFINEGIDIRHLTSANNNGFEPTGITGTINTGNGNLGEASSTLQGWDTFTYSGDWSSVPLSNFDTRLDKSVNGGRDVRLYINGRVDRPERDFNSFEANFRRYIDFGTDVAKLSSVKFGVRQSNEELINDDFRIGAGGINTEGLSEDTIFLDSLTSDSQAEYFNGDFPGYYGINNGWRVLDSENLRTMLQTDRDIPEGAEFAGDTGWLIRTANGLNQFYTNNFSVEQQINAAYVMADFEGELAGIFYSGNLGVRHVQTKNDLIGSGFVEGEDVPFITSNEYKHTLPSLNISLELQEDLILRTAYAEGLVRPNLRAQTPSGTINSTPNRVTIENPRSDVKPYTSKSYDISLEWYNREGSAISFGYFKKEITNLFGDRQTVCPVGAEAQFDGLVGQLERIDQPDGGFICQEAGSFTDPQTGEITQNREVVIQEYPNIDATIDVNGYELAIQQNLDFLPYPWNGFGGVFNYTYVKTDEGDDAPPMTRIAPRSYNIITYWENDGISIRFSYNWQDEKLLSAGGGDPNFLGSDARSQTSGGRLDAALAYKWSENLKLNLNAFNLNNRQEYDFIGGNEDAIHRVRYSGRQYQIFASYTF